jgi:hypothetical protein
MVLTNFIPFAGHFFGKVNDLGVSFAAIILTWVLMLLGQAICFTHHQHEGAVLRCSSVVPSVSHGLQYLLELFLTSQIRRDVSR